MISIRELDLRNFKAFEAFKVTFGNTALLAGPSNAGKSTIIAALRGAAQMLRHARSRVADVVRYDRTAQVTAYSLGPDSFGIVSENLRHEFRNEEVRLQDRFSNGSVLRALWPRTQDQEAEVDEEWNDEEDLSDPAFFYLTLPTGAIARRPYEVKKAFPVIGVVPLLTPIDHDETVLTEEYVRRHSESVLRADIFATSSTGSARRVERATISAFPSTRRWWRNGYLS